MPIRILLIESLAAAAVTSVKEDLLRHGCEITVVEKPDLVFSTAEAEWPDLIVVNASQNLPNVHDLCASLDDSQSNYPRLIISDTKSHTKLPAEAHLLMPFSSRQLAYRLKKATKKQVDRFLRIGNVCLDKLQHRVKCCGKSQHLTPKELRLLQLLMEHPDEVVPRRRIMNEVWETDYLGDTRTLEVHIRWLRKKMEEDPTKPIHIVTVRGTGYVFRAHMCPDDS